MMGTFREDVFKYVREQYATEPDYPWADLPQAAVLRHQSNKKWYALVMEIPKTRLGLASEEYTDIINVKCDPIFIGSLREKEGYFPAYHMNKQNWITVLLDGTVPQEEIFGLLDMSFSATAVKNKRRDKE